MEESPLIGLSDGAIDEKKDTHYYTNKIGGCPDLIPGVSNPHNQCQLCGRFLSHVVQVYCPLAMSLYHRTMNVFACTSPECHGKLGSWKALRSQCLENETKQPSVCQSSSTTSLSTKDWCDDADDWGMDAEENVGNGQTGTAQSETDNFTESLDVGTRLQELCISESAVVKTAEPPTDIPTFQSFYISVVEETDLVGQKDLEHANRLLKEYEEREGVAVREIACSESEGGEEAYEKSNAKHGDAVFSSFMKRISVCPEQVLRNKLLAYLAFPFQDVLENHDDADKPERKRARMDGSNQDVTLKAMLMSISQAICQRLDNMEAKLQMLEATCRALEDKFDTVMGKTPGAIQVQMVAGSPFGATQTCDKVRCVVPQTNVVMSSERPKTGQEEPLPRTTDSLENLLSNTVGRGKQKTIVLKVPAPEESQEDQESGSEASDSVSNSGQSSAQNTNNVTLITLNSEEDYPTGTWLGDENNPEMRVRCPVSQADMLHIGSNCRTPEKMALTLLDYLFHREVQAVSNLSGQGKHGKKQLDPLMIYGIRCHLFHKFAITESDWYRIKQSIDSKCRTAWRRKQRGQSLAVKSFSRRVPAARTGSEVAETASLESSTQQALQYALAGAAQQVQIHRIGEDGQVQVIPQGHLHIAQVPQGEQVQITQDSEGNLQIHQVHVGQDGQVLRGTQLIAVASADGTGTVDASPLQANDIQVQYVQLGPVTDHAGTVHHLEFQNGMLEEGK
ncbi:protein BANP isoform X1, partial [Clarias magur]